MGTACGEGIGGALILALLIRGRAGLRLTRRNVTPNRERMSRLLRISLPAAGESVTNVLCQLWFLRLINRLGPVATAAHGVAIRCEAIAFLSITAFSVAASTLTGQYLGARRPDLAAKSARTCWGLGGLLLSFMGLMFFTQGQAMFQLFLAGRQNAVLDEGVPVLHIVALAMPALATISVLNGSLNGAGDMRWPWLFTLTGYLLVRIPLTYLLIAPVSRGGWSLGLRGAWIAMFVDLQVRAVLVSWRFLSSRWILARV